ncbi:Phosphomethylpyrimidine synthase ThiC [hydrothermal vent metagenome]|uniref:Phosphomethylpyrimidine synthase ThiC n=1 Tax=hydrothermal vent metagenome TaxID=652676 RepID=A0A3B0QUT4_9ZZZZ
MTRLEAARAGIITEEMKEVALAENMAPETIRERIADGTVIITRSTLRTGIKPLGVGRGLSTKVNANIGSSEDASGPEEELEKLKVAVDAGAHAVMDLSTGGDIDAIREAILMASPVPIGTVPVYQAALDAKNKGKSFVELTAEDFFEGVEKHVEAGVDFITVHSGVTQQTMAKMKAQGRIMGIVSRGGALTAEWMRFNKKENPLFEDYPRLIQIAKKYDVVLSLGDGLRPGCLSDATDSAQIDELITLGELTRLAQAEGVQVMIEGPGHMPIDQIEANMLLQKKLCNGAPFYVLGPLVTDIAPGYDHITSAIGGAIAAANGADFLCYVTPSEHLRLPDAKDVRDGVMAARIAAHAGDIAKRVPGAMERDIEMSRARKALDWEEQIRLSIDPETSKILRSSSPPSDEDVCTMCGSLCAIKVGSKVGSIAEG